MIAQGKTEQDVLAAKVTAPYDAKVPGGLLPAGAGTSADWFVSMVYLQVRGGISVRDRARERTGQPPVKMCLTVAIRHVLLPGKEGRLRNVQPSAGFDLVLPRGSVGGRRLYVCAGSTTTSSRSAITLHPASRRRQAVLRFLP